MLTIMVITHNEFEYLKISINSIRLLGNIIDLNLVVIDRGSTDGTRDWCKNQSDLVYVFTDKQAVPYGRMINEARKKLNIQSDLLIMEGHFSLTPEALPRLLATLHQEEKVGAVGCISNSFEYSQGIPNEIISYKTAVAYMSTLTHSERTQVMGLYPNVVLFNAEVLNIAGPFDEHMTDCFYVMMDYYLRMLTNNYTLLVCKEALLWNLSLYPSSMNLHKDDRDFKHLEARWKMHYFNFFYNENLISMIDKDRNAVFNVLEIGCDCGATLLEIKNQYPNVQIYGSDINPNAVKLAALFADVITNDIESQSLPWPEMFFDYIIFGDVLEHLHNPKSTLEYCKKYLKEDGSVIACIPNVMHISVMEQLLNGNFTYTESGLLDRTHIHLFTLNEIVRMFQECNYIVQEVGSAPVPVSQDQNLLIDNLLALNKQAERFMYEAFQYIIKADNNQPQR